MLCDIITTFGKFDWLNITKQTKRLIYEMFERKVEELRQRGEKGPLAHLRYLALKELYEDRTTMKIPFSRLIEERARALRGKGSTDEDEPWGLRFLSVEEIIEESECARLNIRKGDWVKSRFANCLVGCVEDIECRVEMDRLIRKEIKLKGNSFASGSLKTSENSYVYDIIPTLDVLLDALNSAYRKKRKALVIASGNNAKLHRFRTQKACRVNIENLIERYKEKDNFTVVYKPYDSIISHALKVLMVEKGIILAQDLCTGKDKFDIQKHRIVDLIEEKQEVVVIMDDNELAEEELKTIVLDETPLKDEFAEAVDLNYFLSNHVYFRLKISKLIDSPYFHLIIARDADDARILSEYKNGIFSKLIDSSYFHLMRDADDACILSEYKNGIYHGQIPIARFIKRYITNDDIQGMGLWGADEVIIEASKELKDKYFKEEKEFTMEEKKAIKIAIYKFCK